MPSEGPQNRRVDPDYSPTAFGLAVGARVFGRYVLETLIGRGGMGVVWKARDEKLDRVVALKVLAEAVAGDAEAVDDLLRETRRCIELTHPNIARVHDLVQDGPLAAILMEYVDGESLARRKAAAPGGRLTLEELRPLAGQLCAALDYAHGVANVLHRDLRPANLLVTRAGQLKVTDFGISRSLGDTHTRLSGQVGNVGGTLLYMSPQQLLGADPATGDDIYALGATFYELLTGKPPFHTGDVATQIREVMPKSVNARLAALGGDPVPSEWDKTIQACLAKEPEKRPQSAGDVAARLQFVGSDARKEFQGALPREGASVLLTRGFTVAVDPVDARARIWLGPASDIEVKDGQAVVENLPDGEHELIVQAEGYEPFTTLVTVKDGHGKAEARLIAVKGSIAIAARPGTVVTAIDASGRRIELGTVPGEGVLTSEALLTVGSYILKLVHADCAPVEMPNIKLAVGRRTRIAPPQTPLPGELRVFSVPSGAEVRVNGAVVGTTPATIKTQPNENSLQLGIFLRGYRRVQQTLTLKPHEVRTVNVGRLVAECGGIELRLGNANFGWESVEVAIDGEVVGLGSAVRGAPLAIEGLEVGDHPVVATHPDCEPWQQVVAVRDQEAAAVNVELKPRPGIVACETTPAGARVVINGGDQHETTFVDSPTEAEKSTPLSGALPPGEYTLRFELAGYRAVTRPVTVAANRTAEVTVSLEKFGPEEGQTWTVPDLVLEMVPIRPGAYVMGGTNGADDETPPTRVTLAKGYWLGKTEVTQGQWEAEMGTTVAQLRDKGSRKWSLRGAGLDYPIYYVTWDEAMEFGRRLTEGERTAGRLPAGYEYTLPTEAQWEYACRAGTTEDYAGGLDEMAWYGSDRDGQTHPVAQKEANPWGLHDMHGNVWEWCRDWYQDHLTGGEVADPTGPASGSARVARGGSWFSAASHCRSASRSKEVPGTRQNRLGFRLCLAPVQAEARIQAGMAGEPGNGAEPAGMIAGRAAAGVGGAGGGPAEGPLAADLSPQGGKRRSRFLFVASVAALGLAVIGGWFFGFHLPAQRNSAEEQRRGETVKAEQAQAEREKEDGAYAAALQRIAALPDGSPRALVEANELVVQEYLSAAPERHKADVSAAWAKRKLAWETSRLANAKGGLIIRTNPAGTEVRVGGFALEKGPLVILKDVKTGKYPVTVTAPGYEDSRVDAEVKENDFAELTATLVRSTGALQIDSAPAGLAFALQGETPERLERSGRTPELLPDLPTGRYRVTVQRAGWPEPATKTLVVERQKTAVVSAEFAAGMLVVTSDPEGAVIMQNGKEVGSTPWRTECPPGAYAFELRQKGYRTASVSGTLAAKDELRLNAEMKKSLGAEEGRGWTVPGVNLEMAFIQPGTFLMGSPGTESGRFGNEGPQTRVTLTDAFWLGRTDVTHGQWKTVMGTDLVEQVREALADDTVYDFNGRKTTIRGLFGLKKDDDPAKILCNTGDNLPMYYVSWHDAMEFCRRLTERERAADRLPEGYEYTLPSEAQWEYACRADTIEATYAGPLQILGQFNAPVLDAIAWYGGNSSVGYEGRGLSAEDWKERQYPGGNAGPRDVATKQANAWGLHDMLGNVFEWCRDWYGDYPGGSVTDPTGPSSGTSRVLRGGAWFSVARVCRSSFRYKAEPENRGHFVGFRIALTSVVKQ